MISLPALYCMLASVAVSSFSQILLKKSADKTYPTFLRQYLNPFVICGYGLMVLSTLLIILAYRFGIAYKSVPVLEALAYPFILVLSYLLLGEKMTKKKILGNLIIVAGIILFNL